MKTIYASILMIAVATTATPQAARWEFQGGYAPPDICTDAIANGTVLGSYAEGDTVFTRVYHDGWLLQIVTDIAFGSQSSMICFGNELPDAQ